MLRRLLAAAVATAAASVAALAGSAIGPRAGATPRAGTAVSGLGESSSPPAVIADDGVLVPARRGRPSPVLHVFPLTRVDVRYGRSHHDYPATDIPVPCGSPVISAVDGTVWEVERSDRWNPRSDVPATRGGRTVVVDGDDGVRYLFAHFSSIRSSLAVGQEVRAGDLLGWAGSSGRSTGCHLHVGISPPCPGRIWNLLAGTLWPWRYLDAWRAGVNLSPRDELDAWTARYPGACTGTAVIAPAAGIDTGDHPSGVE